LACLSFAGGRAIPKRRRFYSGYDDKVLDDVTFRSFYSKMRNAANSAANAAKQHLRSSETFSVSVMSVCVCGSMKIKIILYSRACIHVGFAVIVEVKNL